MVSKIILFYSMRWPEVGRKRLTNKQLPILRAGQKGGTENKEGTRDQTVTAHL